jgi:cytochrome P450
MLSIFPVALVGRYDHVLEVLSNPARFPSRRFKVPGIEGFDPFGGALTMLTADPPDHTRLRRLVMRAFTPRRVRELEPRIRTITSQLLDNIERNSSFDAVSALADPLPVTVIAELLGVPAVDHRKFKKWSDEIVAADETARGPHIPIPESGRQAKAALRAYFEEQISRRRQNPGEDLISALVAEQEADSLTADELMAFVTLLLLAGNETTTNLIGNGLLALCRHPDQLRRLIEEPALMTTAIDEMLRYDGPVQLTLRYPAEVTEIGGAELPAKTVMAVLLAAANRDPAHFANPDSFDISRAPNEHLALGEGIHFCIGAALAKLEASIAIGTVLERFPGLRLADAQTALQYKGSIVLRGLSSLRLST